MASPTSFLARWHRRYRALRTAATSHLRRDRETSRERSPSLEGRFCDRPFTTVHVNRGGVVTACCGGWLPVRMGSILDASRDRIWNGRKMRAIRESIHDGSFRYCDRYRCPHFGRDDLPRSQEIEDPELRRIIDQRLTRIPGGPKRLDLTYDRSCNLSCPSCRSQVFQLRGRDLREAETVQQTVLDEWLEDADLVKTSNCGDPFGSRLTRKMLQQIDPGRYPKLRLELITNGQLFTPALWKTLHRIQSRIIDLEVSVDAATAETYAVVRRGGRFERLLENFAFIASLRRQGMIPRWRLSFVVQNRNFREMRNFVLLGKRFGVDGVVFKMVTARGGLEKDPETFNRLFRIHDPRNPDHREFLALLRDPVLADPLVDWHALADVYRQHREASATARPQVTAEA